MSLPSGTRFGPYELLAPLGAGGMGEVYRARDSRLDRDVAIKVLPAAFAADSDRLARFDREAKAVAALSHPNVIAIFDTGVHESRLYVVMELLEGATLRDRLHEGPIPVRKAVDIGVRIARGLGAAHGKGIVHRDLKPENIFLAEDGQVKILDFGLARQAAAGESDATETMQATDPGTVLGTVGYMAPEQVRGQPADARADVFAFGAVLYEMLSGTRVFARETAADTMTAILTQDPPELTGSRPDLSPALDRIVRHCLEKNPHERFQSARDIAFALESLTGSGSGPVLTGVPAASAPRASQARPRSRLAIPAAVVAALLLGAAAGYVGRGPAPTSAGVADVTYQPVTFEDGFVFAARFGPDNRTVIYSADWDRQPRGVYVTSLDHPAYRPLGFPGADLLGLSREGDLAILNRSRIRGVNPYMRTGTVARASLTGGAPREELEGVSFADVGPNNTLAVIRQSPERWTVEYPVGQVLDERRIDHGDWQGAFATVRLSPTGDHVAVFEIPGAAARVHIFDRSGKRVAESRPFFDWWSLAWATPNEVWFAAAEAAGRQTAIFSLDLAGRERRVFRAPGAITLHDISPQGDVLVSFDRGVALVESLDAGADRPRDRSWREEHSLSGFSSSHTLLLTGTGDSGGPKGSVYVWKADDPEPVRIADGVGIALSPDGRRAVVGSLGLPPMPSIVPTGAGQPQNIDVGPNASIARAGWMPDGRLVIQSTRPGEATGVFLLSAAGRDAAPLLPAGLALSGFNVIAPDGSRLVAMDGTRQLLVCTVTAPSCRPLPGTRAGDVMSGWNADGLSVFVYQSQPMEVQVDQIEIASGRRSPWKTVRPINAAVTGVSSLMVAPDGALAYDYNRNRSQLYVIKGLK